MVFSRSFFSISLLALPILVIGCGDPADDGGEMPTTTTTTPVTPPPPASTTTTPPASTTTTPPVTPPVTPPPAADTWSTVYPIFQAKCSASGSFCHVEGSGLPPFVIGESATAKTNAEAAKDKIVNRTITLGTMPSGGLSLTADEKAAIQAWADSL